MIEFPVIGGTKVMVVSTDIIATLAPASKTECLVVLKDGREILADLSYPEVRRLVVESRSGFATAMAE
jgi:hypothetical protein